MTGRGLTLETILAAALERERIARALTPVLSSDLLVANAFHRRIGRFLADFLDEHGGLPKEGDWQTWVDGLEDREREGVREQLRDLRGRDLSAWTPDHLLRAAPEVLYRKAAETARSRLNRSEEPGKALPALAVELERIAGVFTPPEERDWPEPVPLGGTTPDPVPTETLPARLRRYVESVSEAVQVPSDLPFLLVLAALSTALAGKLRVKIRSGWPPEPLVLWTVVILAPGARKSPVFKRVIDPIKDAEQERIEEARRPREQAEMRISVLEAQISDKEKDAQRAEDPEAREEILEEIYELQDEVREIEVPPSPTLVVQDVTVEKLTMLMAENDGRLAMLSPEGGIFKIMGGRYKGGTATFDGYKEGWTGDESIIVHRVGRENVHIPRPALTLGLTVQPVVLESLRNRDSFRGEGLLGRFLYAAPDPGFGRRKTGSEVPPLDDEARAAYVEVLRTLLNFAYEPPRGPDHQRHEDQEKEPLDLPLSGPARKAFYDWEAEVEEMLAPWGEFERFRDWGSKLVGQTARLAGILTLAARAAEVSGSLGEEEASAPIPRERMEDAIRIARALIPHARRALLHHVELDRDVTLARYVLSRLRDLTEESPRPPTQSALQQVVREKKGLERAEQLEGILETLEQAGWIQRVEQPSSGPGRPPSPRVILHPDARPDLRDSPLSMLKTVPGGNKKHKEGENRAAPPGRGEGLEGLEGEKDATSESASASADPIRTLEKLARDPDLPPALQRRVVKAFPKPSEEEAQELIEEIRTWLAGEED